MKHRASTTAQVLQDLIRFPSVTPDPAGAMTYIADLLRPSGFAVEVHTHEGVTNLWATWGSAKPLYILCGHVDVVPPGPLDDWQYPPFSPTIVGDRCYGRGACDMKSGLAAMLVAAITLVTQSPPRQGSIGILVTSDEEGPSIYGTDYMLQSLLARGLQPAGAIIGESICAKVLGDRLKIGRRGSINARVRMQGVQGHAAHPHKAHNSIHVATPYLQHLLALQWSQSNPDFLPTSLQITHVHAGEPTFNVIPGTIDIHLNIRTNPAQTMTAIMQAVETPLASIPSPCQTSITWSRPSLPFLTEDSQFITCVRQAITSITQQQPALCTAGGTSDARFFAAHGIPTVEFGGVQTSAHALDEWTSLSDLEPLTACYRQILQNLLPR